MEYSFTKAQVRAIAKSYESGTGLQALAEDYGVSPSVIRRLLVDNGTKIRGRGRPRVSA